MKLKLVYDKQEDIPADYADLYEEKDGKWVAQIEGAKTDGDVARVQEALRKERKDHSETKTKLKGFVDIVGADKTPEDLQATLDEAEALKATGDKGGDVKAQVDAAVEARLKQERTQHERALKAANEKAAVLEAENNGYKAEKRSNTIKEALRKSASENKVIEGAIDDILMYEGTFDVDEDGKVVGKEGGPAAGLEPGVWLTEQQSKKAHWWPPSEGGGAQGGKQDKAGGGKNPWRAENWNLTEQGRIVKTKGLDYAKQLAASAGSKIGATHPTKKAG